MNKLYTELCELLEDFEKDREHVSNNIDLALGYSDDFYSMLNKIKERLDSFLFD